MIRKRITLIAVAMTCIAPILFAQACPDQLFLDITAQPVTLDPNQIAIDPESGNRYLLAVVFCDLGKTWRYEGYICDPEGHAMSLTADSGTLEQDPNGLYTLSATPTSIGITYHTLTLVDTPMAHQQAKTVKATVAAATTRENQAPRFCGGRP